MERMAEAAIFPRLAFSVYTRAISGFVQPITDINWYSVAPISAKFLAATFLKSC